MFGSEELTRELKEVADILNRFKSEAVQLKVLDMLAGRIGSEPGTRTALADNGVDRDLAEVHKETMKAANGSWIETDKLYVSVCSALIALAALFGSSGHIPGPSLSLVGALVFLLSINWAWHINSYRKEILDALDGLAQAHGDSRISQYYQAQTTKIRT